MREGINSSRPRANFPRKISKENIRNKRYLTKYAKENWKVQRNLLIETKVRKRENSRLFKHKADSSTGVLLIYHSVLSFTEKVIGFENTVAYRLCNCL